MKPKKLLLRDKVEVRQFEEGLRGSWHSGVVVGSSPFCRSIKYDQLLSENGKSKLVEHIPVSKAVEGLCKHRYVPKAFRGRIRPLPPTPPPAECCKLRLSYGLCVDAFYEDAWWEGVLLDQDESSDSRSVFFPDEGDERRFNVSDLRVSLEWDEYSGGWGERGIWVLMELTKELGRNGPLSVFVKKVWYHLCINVGFLKKVTEWTCGVRDLWARYLTEAIVEIAVESSKEALAPIPSSTPTRKRKKLKTSTGVSIDLQLHDRVSENAKSNSFHIGWSGESKKSAFHIPRKQKKQGKSAVIHKSKDAECMINSLQDKSETSFLGIDASNHNVSKRRNTQKPQKIKVIMQTKGCITPKGNGDSYPVHFLDESNRISSSSPPYKERQSLKIKIKLDQSKLKKNDKGKDGDSSTNCQTTTDLVPRGRKVREKDYTKSVECLEQATKKKPSVLSQQKKRSMKRESARKKSKSVEVDENDILHDSLIRKKQMTSDVQIKKRQSVSKSKKLGFPIWNSRQTKERTSRVVSKQTNIYEVNGDLKKLQQDSAHMESNSKIEQRTLNAQYKEDDKVVPRRRSVPFANFDKTVSLKHMVSRPRKRKRRHCGWKGSDTICSICQFGGELILCDGCTSSYHMTCIGLKDVPEGKWFCPSCRCGICGLRDSDDNLRPSTSSCSQCLRQYHLDCSSNQGLQLQGSFAQEKFCSVKCAEIFQRLHQLIGKSNSTCTKGLTWIILRSGTTDRYITESSKAGCYKELSHALKIMHDCFEPVVEPHTKRDIVADVIFSRKSKLKRLDYQGFFTMILQKGDDYISVATVRVLGQRVAEMPLIATCFQYRRQGMCRLLVNELKKMLSGLGIERLVLSAIPQLKKTWTTTFGFTELQPKERLELLGFHFMGFQGTTLCQKYLSPSTIEIPRGTSEKPEGIVSENSLVGKCQRFCGLHYKRNRRKDNGKENMVQNCNSNLNTFKHVYKRRRVLTSKGSFAISSNLSC